MSASAKLSIIAPQYDSTTNRAEFISIAESMVNRCLFGTDDRADLAVAYMAAHLITVNIIQGGAGTGEISSKKEGDLAVTYKTADTNGDGLTSTGYGKQFMMLVQSSTPFIGVTNGSSIYGC